MSTIEQLKKSAFKFEIEKEQAKKKTKIEKWKKTTLGESCKMYQPKTISAKDMLDDGKYPVYGANGIIGHYDKYNHEFSQLLITCRGTCGSINISKPFSWINGNAMVIQSNENDLSIHFLEYVLRGGIDLSKAVTGSVQPQITRRSLNPIQFSYPSMEEQRRIVARLDAAFAQIDKAISACKRKQNEIEQLKKSALKSKIEKNPVGETVKFEECLRKTKTPSKIKKSNYLEKGNYPVIAQEENLINGYCNDENLVFDVDSPLIIFGDHTRKLKYIDFDFVLGADGTKIIRPKSNINPKFFFYCLMSQMPEHNGYARHYKLLKNIHILIPPLAEQKRIVKKLDAIFEQANIALDAVKMQLALYESLKSAILTSELGNKT